MTESAIRRRAATAGYTVYKSRRRRRFTPDNQGGYMLLDASGNVGAGMVLGKHFDATLEEIARFISYRV
jgi:hypothetical protein